MLAKGEVPLKTSFMLIGLLFASVSVSGLGLAQAPAPRALGVVVEAAGSPNARAKQKKHYVVLVSLDGFRYDYPEKWGAPHIAQLAQTGATAPDGMLPSYPSITFPNHFTLVTGLYPEHHGIVNNSFYDPSKKATYSYRDPK